MKTEQTNLFQNRIQDILDNKPIKGRKPTPLKGKQLSKNQVTILKEYDSYMKVKGRATKTRYNHLSTLRQFFLTTNKAKHSNITEQDVINFLQKYDNFTTKKIQWEALHSFFKRIGKPEVTEQLRPQNKKRRNIIKDVLTPKEVAKMISYADDFRTKAVISLMMDAGLRIGEVIALKVKNLIHDDYGMKLIIEEGKTGERQVRLTDCIPDLRNHLNSFKFKVKGEDEKGNIVLVPDPEAYLFYSFSGYKPENRNKEEINDKDRTLNNTERKMKGISYNGVYSILKQIAEVSGIKKNVHPHIFRHSAAHRLLMEGWSVHEVKEHLGHASIMSTEVYLNYSKKDYHNAVLKRKGLIDKNGKEAEPDRSLELKTCWRCGYKENPGHVQFCEHCNSPITIKAIERVKARHTVKGVAKYEGLPEGDREALITLIHRLFDKGVLNPDDFRGKITP